MKKQTIYIPTKVEDELPESVGWYDVLERTLKMDADRMYFDGTDFINKKPFTITHWIKETESHVFTTEELKEQLSNSFQCGREFSSFNESKGEQSHHTGYGMKYDNVEEIIDDYYQIRLEYYEDRKEYMIDTLEREIMILSNKAKYIKFSSKEEINDYILNKMVI